MNPLLHLGQQLNVSNLPANLDGNARDTLQVVDQIIKKLVSEHSKSLDPRDFHSKINTSESIFSLEASIGLLSKTVYLTPLYFIDRSQVPFDGPNDPTLKDTQKLQAFADTLAARCNIPRQIVTWKDRMSLRMYLTATAKPKKISKMMSFVLMHEIGHIHHQHGDRKSAYKSKFSASQ